MTAKETTSTQIGLPSTQIQADRRVWLQQVQRGEQGDPAKVLKGLSASYPLRWEIGIADAWQHQSDPTKIVLKLPKPASYPEGEESTTEYLFDQETVWLLQAHISYGGRVGIYISKSGEKGNKGKPNGYFYPAIWIDGLKGHIPVDRLVANAGPHRLAQLVNPHDYHNHTQANIKLTAEREVVAQVGRENVRTVRGPAREAAIGASLKLWHESVLFPSRDHYRAALLHVYAVLDQRHPLLAAGVATTTTC
ncbi:hypothetical protein [Mesorhizobium australicum]|uniref:hypothetical protein n=1 Tax=Mesorhizobium australicum TaxID=536018 RepID=UPI003339624B